MTKKVWIPLEAEMQYRLCLFDPNEELQRDFYPKLFVLAGKKCDARMIAGAVAAAIFEYSDAFEARAGVLKRVRKFIACFVNDESIVEASSKPLEGILSDLAA